MELLNVTCINGTNANCTGNTTCLPCQKKCLYGSCELDEIPLSGYAKIRIFIYIITFVLSLMGNGCIMLVTVRKLFARQSITAFKLLITHLALVDFLLSCNTFVLIPNELHNTEADDGMPMCTFKRMLRQIPLAASIGTIAIISIERYRGVTKDFHIRKWTLRRVCVSLIIVWIASVILYIPTITWLKTTRGDVDCKEVTSLQNKRIYAAILILVEYALPLAVVGYCNFKIIKVIRARNQRLAEIQSEENKQRHKEQKKTVKILYWIVFLFAILALPNQIFFAYLDIADNRETFSKASDVLQSLGIILLFHTWSNPLVYSILDGKFREDARMLCRGWCCCCFRCCNGRGGRESSFRTAFTTSGRKAPEEPKTVSTSV